MAKRKRDEAVTGSDLPVKQRQAPDKSAKVETAVTKSKISGKSTQQTTTSHGSSTANSIHDQGSGFQVQIITGSYDKVLHGFAATLPTKAFSKSSDDDTSKQNGHKATDDAPSAAVSFADSFLFTAHSASVRSIAVSQPNESHRRVLATGSADERINLYHVSTAPMKRPSERTVSLLNHSTVENPRNRELGSLLHHSRSVNKLFFPTRGKLFSASEDNTIAISRTRDWTVLSTIKSPVPKPIGRPSGDTAGPGEVPAGVNDFAIHPSMKLMLSVGKGERCMRLWNLVTGKKAGVLNFDKDLLQQAGEGKYSSGEGQKIVWTESGERFVAVFERGAVLFGMDSKPIAVIRPSPSTKVHQVHVLRSAQDDGDLLAVSTEDGRIIFFDLDKHTEPSDGETKMGKMVYPRCVPIAQLGGSAAGVLGRVKDFEILDIGKQAGNEGSLLCVVGSSDGTVRLWSLDRFELSRAETVSATMPPQVGALIASQKTDNRITCLTAFVLDGPKETPERSGQETNLAAGAEPEPESEEEST